MLFLNRPSQTYYYVIPEKILLPPLIFSVPNYVTAGDSMIEETLRNKNVFKYLNQVARVQILHLAFECKDFAGEVGIEFECSSWC